MKLLESCKSLTLWTKILALFVAMLGILSLNGCKDNDLIVATSANFAPFEYIDGEEFKGIDMDIAKIIAKKLNKKLVIKDMEFDSVVTSLASGNAHIALSGLTINDTRSKVIDFSQTYFSASQMVIAKTNDARFTNITTKEDLLKTLLSIPNLKIGVQIGTTGEFYAKGNSDWGFEGFHNAQVKSFSNGTLATTAMKNEQIDIVIIDEMPARKIVKANSGTQLIDIALTNEKYAIGIAPNEKELKDSINAILDEMQQDGTLENIINEYYVQ